MCTVSECSFRGYPLVIEVCEKKVLTGFRVHSTIPREACSDQADVKVEKHMVTIVRQEIDG